MSSSTCWRLRLAGVALTVLMVGLFALYLPDVSKGVRGSAETNPWPTPTAIPTPVAEVP